MLLQYKPYQGEICYYYSLCLFQGNPGPSGPHGNPGHPGANGIKGQTVLQYHTVYCFTKLRDARAAQVSFAFAGAQVCFGGAELPLVPL